MNDHETAIVECKREELLREHEELEKKLFKQLPLKEKVHLRVFEVTFICLILFGVWLAGYIVYALIFKRP